MPEALLVHAHVTTVVQAGPASTACAALSAHSRQVPTPWRLLRACPTSGGNPCAAAARTALLTTGACRAGPTRVVLRPKTTACIRHVLCPTDAAPAVALMRGQPDQGRAGGPLRVPQGAKPAVRRRCARSCPLSSQLREQRTPARHCRQLATNDDRIAHIRLQTTAKSNQSAGTMEVVGQTSGDDPCAAAA